MFLKNFYLILIVIIFFSYGCSYGNVPGTEYANISDTDYNNVIEIEYDKLISLINLQEEEDNYDVKYIDDSAGRQGGRYEYVNMSVRTNLIVSSNSMRKGGTYGKNYFCYESKDINKNVDDCYCIDYNNSKSECKLNTFYDNSRLMISNYLYVNSEFDDLTLVSRDDNCFKKTKKGAGEEEYTIYCFESDKVISINSSYIAGSSSGKIFWQVEYMD